MNRKQFISHSGKVFLGSLTLPYTNLFVTSTSSLTPAYAGILRSIYPIALSFLERIVEKGVEKYVTDQLADWLEINIGSQEVQKKEIKKLPEPIRNNQVIINGDHTNVFMGLDKLDRPEVILIPLLQDNDTEYSKLLSDYSYVPIFKKEKYLGAPNFPELVALDQLAEYFSNNINLGRYKSIYLSNALLPSTFDKSKARTFFSIKNQEGAIGSSVIKTQRGSIHVVYDISDKLKVEGQVSFMPKDKYGRFPYRKIDFSHDFSKK